MDKYAYQVILKMKQIILLLSIWLTISCTEKEETAAAVVDKAIAFHGGSAYDSLSVKFKFRDRLYQIKKVNKTFTYKRIFIDSLENILLDVLTNNGLIRTYADTAVVLSAKDSIAFANSVNSVQYFALLPKPLQDPAVILNKKAGTNIKNKAYYTIQVTFKRQNGGNDFDDVFMYWFDKEDYRMDYLAYHYHTDGGGIRFRAAYNSREVDGVIFQDYHNYEVPSGTDLVTLPAMYEAEALTLLSEIELVFIE